MATQQQTVLRVQTNIPDNTIVVQSGYTAVITGDTFGISYSGTGTVDDPYTGTTSGISEFTFSINDRSGILYYEYSGSSAMTLYVNDVVQRYDSNKTVSGTINVNDTDIVKLYFGVTASKIINLYFVASEEVVYKYELLDLYGDIPIKINKSFAELQDIGKRNSDYSIGLQLPGSKKNNRFFESFFNVDIDTLYFNVLSRVPCSVLIEDESYFNGYLKLNKISVLNSKIEYDVTLFSSVGDLYGKIGNNLLKDLNFTDTQYGINHEFSKFEVQNWDNNPFSQDNPPNFFYPIVHNGYNYSGETPNVSGATVSGQTRLYTSTIVGSFVSAAAAYAAGVKRYRLNSFADGLLDNQLKPALNVKNLIALMFKTYGYTIDSDFFNTPWFKMLYTYGYFSSDTTKFSYKTPVPQTLTLDGVNVIFVETYVDSSEYPCGTQYFKTDRTYTIYVVKAGTGTPCLCADEINLNLAFRLNPCTGGVPTDFIVPVTIAPNTTGTTYSWVSNQYVDCGSGCPFSLEYTQNFVELTTGNVSISPAALAYPPVTPNTIRYFEDGDYVDFSLVINEQLKQIDFLSSIAKKFNLVFVPNPNNPTEIKIEPYSYYIGTGDIYDWTNKLSYDKGFTVEPAQNYVEAELILTDQEDGDYGNKVFKDQNNRIYGQNFVFNETDFKSQTKKIDTIFSPELLRQWDTPDTAPNGEIKLPLGINYAASSSPQSSGGTEKVSWQYTGVKTKPKLFYHLGFFNLFLDTLGEALLFNGAFLTNQVYIATSSGTNPRGRYVAPVISHTMPIGNDDANKINNDSISVLFNSEQPVDLGVTPFDVYTENDSYNLFYSNRVNNLYNKNTRFLGGYFDLKISDIKNLKPNDIIKIKDQYFTWNKIDAFNLTNPELTKVELIQFNNQVNTYPTRYFQYYYCDNPGVVFKFKTDMTNPSLSGTSYGWSVFYDYSIGVLNNAGITPLTGFTSSVRDIVQDAGYVPYTIYEVTEVDYNASGISRNYDTFWLDIVQGSFSDGDLNEGQYPSYIYGTSYIIYNLFEDCAQFNAAASAYSITTGSSTFYGPPVTPTPTPSPTPMPTPTPGAAMRGSLIMSFDELIPDRGVDNYIVEVNNIIRDNQFTETDNLYSTFLYPGDVVTIQLIVSGSRPSIDVSRRDYTTDDQGNDMGIRDTYITGTTGTTSSISITFTATTIAQDYNFEYRVIATTITIPPTPTPTIPPPTGTPTPTPTATAIPPTPTPTATTVPAAIDSTFIFEENTNDINILNATDILVSVDQQYTSVGGAGLLDYSGNTLQGLTKVFDYSPLNEECTTADSEIGGTGYYVGGNWTEWTRTVPSAASVFPNKTAYITSGFSYSSTWLEQNNIPTKIRKFSDTSRGHIVASNNNIYFTGPATTITGQTYDFAEQTDGKLIRIGEGTSSTGYTGIQRITTGYTVDSSFVVGTGFYSGVANTEPSGIAIQSDGKIIVVGYFTSYSGISAPGIIRLNTDGTKDTTFSGVTSGLTFTTGNPMYLGRRKVVIDTLGNIYIAGDFDAYNGNASRGLVKLTSNGTYDSSFSVGTGFYTSSTLYSGVYTVAIQSNNKLLVGGTFNYYNGTSKNGLVRINT